MTLTEFLLARIMEDEEDARSAMATTEGRGEQWEVKTGTYSDHVRRAGPHLRDRQIAEATFGARHMARWDPARVLAECAAKRRIIELADPYIGDVILSALALPYADHPDYPKQT